LVAAFGIRISSHGYYLNPKHEWNGNYLAFSTDHGDSWSHVVQLTSGEPTMQYMSIEKLPGKNEFYVAYTRGVWADSQTRHVCGRKVKVSL